MIDPNDAVCLHHVENAGSLAILESLLSTKKRDWEQLGYEPDDFGAVVSWKMLYNSYLSPSEMNCVRLAEVIVRFERYPGMPSSVPAKILREALSGRARILSRRTNPPS
jgi:hypothetical protein